MSSLIRDDELSMSISTPHNPPSHGPAVGTAAAARAPPPNHTPKTAQRMGQYTVIRTLGEGSFGKVKLATHAVSGQKVALKIIARRKLVTRDMAGRIEREIQYLQLLRHPHIIKLYTVITNPSEVIMVLEYAGGELFDYIVQHGKMAEDKARKFFQQIVCAVEYCHRHKIVHRDLKPENLLLDDQLNVKIADFGLSNIMTDGNFLKTSCGSPNYAAPEVISGKLYAGPEVDVWSCGVILYVLLVSRLPFDDDYIPALFRKISAGNYAIPSYLSTGAVKLIKRMLQVSPTNRITIAEIRQDEWFNVDLPDYLQPQTEEFMDTGIDPNKAIDPRNLARGKPVAEQEQIHTKVVHKLGKTMGYAPTDVQEALSRDEPSAIKDAYLIVRENQIMQANPSLLVEQPAFMAQSPPPLITHHSMTPRPSPAPVRPSPSPLMNMEPRHGSTGSSNIVEARSPASTVAILTSSTPAYHTQYMAGHAAHPREAQAPEGADIPRNDEEREAMARRLKPHSRSSTNLARQAEEKPQAATDSNGKPTSKKSRPIKWQFGIRSRNSPTEALVAIYKSLSKMGAQWEVPTPKEVGVGSRDGSQERRRDSDDYNSPEYSDSDPGSGTDPEYATHEEQEKRRAKRQAEGGKGERFGRYNDWGYVVPEDPWVIKARFKKTGLYPVGTTNNPGSAHNSQVNLSDRNSASVGSMSQLIGAENTSGMENVAATGPPATHGGSGFSSTSNMPMAEESVWVYVTIQIYSIEKDFYLVDFKCSGYENLVRRFAAEVNGTEDTDIVAQHGGGGSGSGERDLAPEGHQKEDGDVDAQGRELIGTGIPKDDKEITSPFPFLEVASRLIIQLAEQPES